MNLTNVCGGFSVMLSAGVLSGLLGIEGITASPSTTGGSAHENVPPPPSRRGLQRASSPLVRQMNCVTPTASCRARASLAAELHGLVAREKRGVRTRHAEALLDVFAQSSTRRPRRRLDHGSASAIRVLACATIRSREAFRRRLDLLH